MRSKVVFYCILGVMVGVSGYAVYRLVFNSSEVPAPAKSLTKTPTKWRPGMKLSESMKETSDSSIWKDLHNDENLRTRVGTELKASAEVENNLKLLISLYDQGLDEEFLPKLEELIRKFPDVPEYTALKGDYLYNEGKWEEAEAAVKRLTELDPNNNFARNTLGEIQAIQGNYDGALGSLKQVIQKDPGNLDALYGVLSVHDMKGMGAENPEQARAITDVGRNEILENAKQHPENPNAAVVAATVAASMGKIDEQEKIIRGCRELNPSHSGCARLDAEKLIINDHFKEAISAARLSYENEKVPELKRESLEIWLKAARAGKDSAEEKHVAELIRQDDENSTGE